MFAENDILYDFHKIRDEIYYNLVQEQSTIFYNSFEKNNIFNFYFNQ